MTDTSAPRPDPLAILASTPVALHPLAEADPLSLTALFDADPTTLSEAGLDRLISEFRSRADAFASEEAKKSAAPKAAKPPAAPKTKTLAGRAAADKSASEVSLDDLFTQ